MALPHSVRIVEVGPRDGLQNEARSLDPATRAALIEALADAGLVSIEAGSFVSPRAVPQMAGTADVLRRLRPRGGVTYSVLVPNMRGFEEAAAAGAREIAVFAAASETFSRRNVNCSVVESVERFRPVAEAAADAGLRLRGYVSCVLGCPYEGAVPVGRVVAVAGMLDALGCAEISLGDTVGIGTPPAAREMVRAVAERVAVRRLAVHFHDTYGMALANVFACLEEGVSVVDAAVSGLGGCPYAPGAGGNLATEDLVTMLDRLGVQCGVDAERLLSAGRLACDALGRVPGSKLAAARQVGRRGDGSSHVVDGPVPHPAVPSSDPHGAA